MELKLENGRYIPDADGMPEQVDGVYELAQRVAMKLAARRGAFLPMPGYGSRIYTLTDIPANRRAERLRSFVYEALADEKNVYLKNTRIEADGGTLRIRLDFVYGTAGFTIEMRSGEA